jgi:hypothetical protein
MKLEILHIALEARQGNSDEDTVVITCYHPGYLSQAGLPSIKATILFFNVHQIVWYGMHVALSYLQDKSKKRSRKELCDQIMLSLHDVLSPEHKFG